MEFSTLYTRFVITRDTSGNNALAYVEKHNWGGGMSELLIAHGSGPAYVK